jgi:nitrogen fixation protein FixH
VPTKAAEVSARESRLRYEPWPLAIAGSLLAMAVVLALFLWTAISHPDPVLVNDTYAAGQRYNEELQATDRAVALGWQLDVRAAPTPLGARVAMRLVDAQGRALSADHASLRRERPAQGGFDQTVALKSEADGVTAEVPLPLPGRWWLEARIEHEGAALVRRIAIEMPR